MPRGGQIARAAEFASLERQRALLDHQMAAWEDDARRKALFTHAAEVHERAAVLQEWGVSFLLLLERRRGELRVARRRQGGELTFIARPDEQGRPPPAAL